MIEQALINPSSYPNCIRYEEIDFTKGCEVGCLYCGLAKSKEKISNFEIETVLSNLDNISKGIYFSPNSDAFSPLAFQKTHKVLKEVIKRGKKILINTKCVIPDQTIELLSDHSELCTIQVSIGRLDQNLTNFLEPHSASVKERLNNIQKMSSKGLWVNGLIMPMFPGVDDEQYLLKELVEQLVLVGVKCIKAAYVILNFGDGEKSQYILKQLKYDSRIGESLSKMTEQIKAHIGEGNIAPFESRLATYQFIKKLCDENGIKFLACSVLDTTLIEKQELPCKVCRNVLQYRN